MAVFVIGDLEDGRPFRCRVGAPFWAHSGFDIGLGKTELLAVNRRPELWIALRASVLKVIDDESELLERYRPSAAGDPQRLTEILIALSQRGKWLWLTLSRFPCRQAALTTHPVLRGNRVLAGVAVHADVAVGVDPYRQGALPLLIALLARRLGAGRNDPVAPHFASETLSYGVQRWGHKVPRAANWPGSHRSRSSHCPPPSRSSALALMRR